MLSLLPVLSCLYRPLLSEGVGNYSPLQQVLQGSHMTWTHYFSSSFWRLGEKADLAKEESVQLNERFSLGMLF